MTHLSHVESDDLALREKSIMIEHADWINLFNLQVMH